MNIQSTVLSCVCLALNCCQPEKCTYNLEVVEDRQSEKRVRVIQDWGLAVLESGTDVNLVEWPSLAPIPLPPTKEDNGWNFIVVGTEKGSRTFEWPSLIPIRDTEKKTKKIDVNDLPPSPGSRLSR